MRLLVIENDVQVRTAVRQMMKGVATEIAEASDGVEGITMFRAFKPSLVVCDIFMDGKDGLEVIRELRQEFRDVTIVAMSGGGPVTGINVLPLAKLAGADDLLHKPFSRSALMEVLGRLGMSPSTL